MTDLALSSVPVVTLDGPGGAGKGTISYMLAKKLGWHLLDSGAMYRVLALAAQHHGISLEDEKSLGELAEVLDVEFRPAEDSPVCEAAMAFAVAALQSEGDIEILNCSNVATSFPNFIELATQVGMSVRVLD